MRQVLDLIRLFGLRRLWRMKKRHDKALPLLRGYCTTTALWSLFNTGALDEIGRRDGVSVEELAATCGLDARVLGHLLEYLDCTGVLQKDGERYSLGALGRALVQEPRGAFDLACGYEPVLYNLEALLRGEAKFGRDVERRGKFIAQGSGELGAQLPFPVLADLVLRSGLKTVLDLGCGDLEFLFYLCRQDPDVRGYGIDRNEEAVRHACSRLSSGQFNGRVNVEIGDLFEIDETLSRWNDVQVLTACDVFHEHLLDGPGRVAGFLAHMHGKFPNVAIAVAEFCRQPHERLKRRPTAFVEHHLWHNLTDQVILSAGEWRTLFRDAGFRIAQERVFDIVGHGYFLLR